MESYKDTEWKMEYLGRSGRVPEVEEKENCSASIVKLKEESGTRVRSSTCLVVTCLLGERCGY